jgi:hypothetical protein
LCAGTKLFEQLFISFISRIRFGSGYRHFQAFSVPLRPQEEPGVFRKSERVV